MSTYYKKLYATNVSIVKMIIYPYNWYDLQNTFIIAFIISISLLLAYLCKI